MKKTVFLTGATGNMGYAAFKELYKRRHMYDLVLLVLPYEKEKAEKAAVTKDCRQGCNGCGIQRFKGVCSFCE